jgi:hypothetical protein
MMSQITYLSQMSQLVAHHGSSCQPSVQPYSGISYLWLAAPGI